MGHEFPSRVLSDLVRLQGGYAFRSKDWQDHGVPVVKIANVLDGRIDMEKCSHVSDTVAATANNWALAADDILVGMTGYVGAVGRIDAGQLPALLNQRVGRFQVIDPHKLDADFLYFALRQPSLQAHWKAIATGSAQANISGKQLVSASIPHPPLSEQRRIAAMLLALDNKIELNRQMNRTLEAMAAALFKSWFIDFDGHDDLVDSELGPIPRGWGVRPLDEVAHYLNGAACQKFRPADDEESIPVIKIRELNQGITANTDRATSSIPEKWHVFDGDVLFSWSGSLVVQIWTGGAGALNQHLFKVTSADFPRWFFYMWTDHHLRTFQRIAAAKATTMGHIKRSHLAEAKCVVPPNSVILEQTAAMGSLIDRTVANSLESRTLVQLRDTLLPKLISGELRVPEAERRIEDIL